MLSYLFQRFPADCSTFLSACIENSHDLVEGILEPHYPAVDSAMNVHQLAYLAVKGSVSHIQLRLSVSGSRYDIVSFFSCLFLAGLRVFLYCMLPIPLCYKLADWISHLRKTFLVLGHNISFAQHRVMMKVVSHNRYVPAGFPNLIKRKIK